MQKQVQITFRHMEPSNALTKLANQKFAKLVSKLPETVTCHVVVEHQAASHTKGGVCLVRVDVHSVQLQVSAQGVHVDAQTAIREAFDHVRARLDSQLARRRQPVDVRPRTDGAPLQTNELAHTG